MVLGAAVGLALLFVVLDSFTYHWRQRLVRYASARLRRSKTLRRREVHLTMDVMEPAREAAAVNGSGMRSGAAVGTAAAVGGDSSAVGGSSEDGGVVISRRLHEALLAVLAELPEAKRLQQKDL